jgi:hypothetical protein
MIQKLLHNIYIILEFLDSTGYKLSNDIKFANFRPLDDFIMNF